MTHLSAPVAPQICADLAGLAAHLRDALEAVRDHLCQAADWPVHLEYGTTDDGSEHWAALFVDSLPPGSFGHPGLLVSLLAGPGIPGCAVVTSADGRTTVHTVATAADVAEGLRIVEAEALQQFRALSEGEFA